MIKIFPDKLLIKPSEIRNNINVSGDPSDWFSCGSNCYAYALGLDINENSICKHAYQPGIMGSIILNLPIINLKEMPIEERMLIDLEALKIKYKEVEPEENYNYTFHTYKNSNAISSITYDWPVAVFEAKEDLIDFHFMRKWNDGTWRHKLGFVSYPNENDFDGKIITDPRECNLGPYKYKKTYLLTLNQKW